MAALNLKPTPQAPEKAPEYSDAIDHANAALAAEFEVLVALGIIEEDQVPQYEFLDQRDDLSLDILGGPDDPLTDDEIAALEQSAVDLPSDQEIAHLRYL